jgi:hypothetical protein
MAMLENMVAVQNEGGAYIGHLFWYSIMDCLYSRQKLETELKAAGLSIDFMPNEIRPVDAFRRATKEVETRRNLGNGVVENYMVRDVYSDSHVTVRHIVLETADSHGKELSYNQKEAVLTLDRKTGDISFQAAPGLAEDLCKEVMRLYDSFKTHHNGQAVRGMVQSILRTLSPTPVRPSGGVYFVPSAHSEELAKLVRFCSSFAKGEGFKVPMVETQESIEMVATKVADHLDGILGQCRNALADGTLTKPKLAEMLNEAKGIVSGYKDYESILVKQKEEMEARIQLVRDAMVMLLDRVA